MSAAASDAGNSPEPVTVTLTPAPPPTKPSNHVSPQKSIDKFWKKFTTKHPGKPFTILPDNLYAKRAAIQASRRVAASKNAVASYEQAAATCKAKVDKIVRDCRRLNQKYKDPHFDIEFDLMSWQWSNYEAAEDCLVALDKDNGGLRPMSVKRIEDIFDEPHFYIDGATANDVRQGRDGDCWFMSSVCTLSNKEDLLEKVCVARDQNVGVYGFVFYRDGEWISEVIDDKLYLAKEDFHESFFERYDWLAIDMPNPDDEYRKVMQTGSKALYFAQCRDPNETWLPLLEKAYAKAHGDYGAIEGGWVGEGLEDLTGGVTSELFTADILDKNAFWTNELMNVNKLFLFGLAQMGGRYGERSGIIEKHAYSIMEARELDNERLLKIRNPWGKKEWDGPWSDGSEQWTPDYMRRLNHKFGNDGVFWISYKDLLKHFQHIDRTRLFGPEWSVTQQWTSVNVPWSVNYLDTHFRISLSKAGPVVVMLSQLDDRYFRGLEGQYYFQLQFRLHKDGETDYIARSNPSYFMNRSVVTELDLEAGQYSVMIKITASRNKDAITPEEVIRKTCQTRPEKLMSVGLSYDLAHAKSRLKETEAERKKRLQREQHDKTKSDAKKAFEAQRVANKKEKLRRLRLEDKVKNKKVPEPEPVPEEKKKVVETTKSEETKKSEEVKKANEGIQIWLKVGEDALKPSKVSTTSEGVDESKVVLKGGTSKQLKITVETSDGAASAGSDLENTSQELQKPKAGDDDQQAVSTGKVSEETSVETSNDADKGGDTAVTGEPVTDKGQEKKDDSSTSTADVTPSTSAEGSSAAEDSSKSEVQPVVQSGDSLPTVDEAPTTKATDAPTTAELKVPVRKLTLDDVSDDGLSWSSDIDLSFDTPSDSDSSDSDSETAQPAPPPPSNNPNDDFANDPWNAVCVVGLRVYSKGSEAEIAVARKRQDGEAVENKKLDVDDQAADATKKVQKDGKGEERELGSVGNGPVMEEDSKQG